MQNNAVRKWYHAPGLLAKGTPAIPASGREFIRGLTRERVNTREMSWRCSSCLFEWNLANSSRPPARRENSHESARQTHLADHTNQMKRVSNWAVGFYNSIAAFTVGKVWANPATPNTAAVKFEDGAVAFKLLFTSATDSQVPFLANSMKWQANINLEDLVPASTVRQPRDGAGSEHGILGLGGRRRSVAVRDNRADDTTGWVFGTFMYQNDAPGAGAAKTS